MHSSVRGGKAGTKILGGCLSHSPSETRALKCTKQGKASVHDFHCSIQHIFQAYLLWVCAGTEVGAGNSKIFPQSYALRWENPTVSNEISKRITRW